MRTEVKLLGKETVGDTIIIFYLEKPNGFQFQSGQFCNITLPSIGFGDEKELRHSLSIASAPVEKGLIFATRLSDSAFKKTLKNITIGSMVTIDGPFGMFTLPEDATKPVILLAGGLGITPFRSMMKGSAESPTVRKLTLFYSSRVPEEAVFFDELREMANAGANINLVVTMTRPEQSSVKWTGPVGRLSPAMIRNGCKEWADAIYFMAGPPAMVETSQQILEEMAIPHDRVRTEKWGT